MRLVSSGSWVCINLNVCRDTIVILKIARSCCTSIHSSSQKNDKDYSFVFCCFHKFHHFSIEKEVRRRVPSVDSWALHHVKTSPFVEVHHRLLFSHGRMSKNNLFAGPRLIHFFVVG
uniref:Uncharacterized protein n=1 Tax=Rhizophora mucronata TaxID=61149 RepID=A0A2P2KKA2_RHIMU